MARYTVLVEFDPEGPGYVVHVPALPGCITRGGTVKQALLRAREAVAGHVTALLDLGEPVPVETDPSSVTGAEPAV